MMKYLCVPLWCVLMGLSAPAAALAQSSATLSGVVSDETGGVLSNVGILVINTATNLERKTETDKTGAFVVPLLQPGRYLVKAARDGFLAAEVRDVNLNVADQVMLKVRLKLDSLGESVTIVSDAARVSTSPAVATTIDRQFAENLPLNGRSLQSLIMLAPGVTVMGGGAFSVNGQRTNTNYFTVDGMSANFGVSPGATADGLNGDLPALSVSGVTTGLVSVDALEEFKLQTSTYAAEFGRQQGGQVQLVTRSGTNQFHGSAYEYFRDDALDANDWFANQAGLESPPMQQHQFGGTLGGPLRLLGRDRTFFFASHESQRLQLPDSRVFNVPSLRLRELAAPAVRPFLDAFSLPDGPEAIGADGDPLGYAPLTMVTTNPTTSDATSLRLDYVANSTLTFNGRYNYAPSFARHRYYGASLSQDEVNTQSLTAGATMTHGRSLSADVRFNYSRGRGFNTQWTDDFGGAVPIDQASLVEDYSGSGTRRGEYDVLNLGDIQIGDGTSSFQQQFNLVASATWLTGAHRFKFGVDYRRLAPVYEPIAHDQENRFYSEEGIRSSVLTSVFVSSSPEVRPRFDNVAAYAQDTWQVSPRLTLDLGLRWDVNPPPYDANGLEPVLIEGMNVPADLPNARLAPPGTPVYETFWTGFAPRLGATYQLAREGGRETVLRGGFGFYYDLGSSQSFASFTTFPFQASAYAYDVPYPIPSELALHPPLPEVALPIESDLHAVNPGLTLPYSMQWNVAVERSLGRSQTITATYVGSAARRLLVNYEANQAADPNRQRDRPNPNFSNIRMIANGGTSDYHALQLQYQRRLSRGLQAMVSHTWGHAIDLVSQDMIPGSPGLTRGNAAFDMRHKLTAAVTFQAPGWRVNPVLAGLTSGWGIDVIAQAQSGLPVDVRDGDLPDPDGTKVAYRPDLVPGVPFYLDDPTVPGGRRFNPAALRALPTGGPYNRPLRPGNLGRNVFRALPLYQVDLALNRRFRLAQRLMMQLRVEAFNVFNHPSFAGYNGSLYDPATFGVATSMMSNDWSARWSSGGGLSSLYQIGGPRSMQLSLRFTF